MRRNHDEAPTKKDIEDLYDERKRYYQGFVDECTELEELYELEFAAKVPTPEGYDAYVYIPGTARALVDEPTDHVVTDFPTMWVPIRGSGKDAKPRASRLTAWLAGMWHFWASHGDIAPLRDFVKNLFLFGKAHWELLPDWAAWPEAEFPKNATKADREKIIEEVRKSREHQFPLVLRSVPPYCIFEDPTAGRKRDYLKVYQKARLEIEALYDAYVKPEGADWSEQVEVHEYWDENFHQVIVDGQECISNPEHNWGVLPLVTSFSGLGRESGDGEHEKKARGILYGAKSGLLAEARSGTQHGVILAGLAWPIILGEMTSEELAKLDMTPGAMNEVPEGFLAQKRISWFQPQLPTGEILQHKGAVQSDIQRVTYPAVVRGERPTGTTSAAQIALLSGAARLRFGSVVSSTERSMERINEKGAHYVKHVLGRDDPAGGAVVLWSYINRQEKKLEIKPQDIMEPFVTKVELKPSRSEEMERRQFLGLERLKAGALDLYGFLVMAGEQNPEEMITRILADDILKDPVLRRALARQALADQGMDVSEIAFQETMLQLMDQYKISSLAGSFSQNVPGETGMRPGTASGGQPLGTTTAAPGSPEEMAAGMQQMRGGGGG